MIEAKKLRRFNFDIDNEILVMKDSRRLLFEQVKSTKFTLILSKVFGSKFF